jgi:hypothetical protein
MGALRTSHSILTIDGSPVWAQDIPMSGDLRSQVSKCLSAMTDPEIIPAAGEWESLVPSPIQTKAYLARNVDFCDDGASILVYYCESHEMYVVRSSPFNYSHLSRSICYSIEPWSVKWARELPTRM